MPLMPQNPLFDEEPIPGPVEPPPGVPGPDQGPGPMPPKWNPTTTGGAGDEGTPPPDAVETTVEGGDTFDAGMPELPPLPPSTSNRPLALPGTFTNPGTPAAVPYRTSLYAQGRRTGGDTFGPGDTGVPGGPQVDFATGERKPGEDDLIRRIVHGLGARRP